MSDNIKVVVKVRPLISREIEDKLSYQWRVKSDTLYQLDHCGREFGPCFTFDKVYDKETKTSDVYKDVAKPIVEATTAGFNGTIFAYGQTSSGKTYTMTGTEHAPGIIPMAVSNLFEIIRSIPNRDFLVRVSYLEIYNETVKDLLNIEKKDIKVHDSFQGVKVNVTEKVTTSPEEVFKCLKQGEANRQTGATNMNEESSRSHSIFQITIESREHIEGDEEATGCVNVSQLNLVDLAGSERAGQTGATGLRFKEGTHINKSLSSLALVIKQLSEDPNKYVNYRDSKLTRILQNSLGGNAKTSIICAITPAAVEETISTLQFANRAKAIKNKPEVNAVATDKTMIQSLTKQLSKLQAQLESKRELEVMLESKKNVEQDNQQLQTKIAALQRLILNGFGQRSSAEIIGPRRKNVQPRRVTISTLHSIAEDHVATVPKFCTPVLKYNPMSFPSTSDFVPIQNASKLETLPEEVRLITPPPRNKKINSNEEIIDLDSDNDTSTDISCSPYHQCFVSSKTPPCILRKNAKAAEDNLKEIEELTKREKIYEPRVNELIEKLQQNTTVIANLQENINNLTEQTKQKDLQIEQLKCKVGKSEDEVKSVTSAKVDTEAKLVDLEVIYETLKQNSKRREQELLSLLDDKPKKNEDIGKLPSRTFDKELSHFMDMSKDISLVNSDNDSSITNTNDDESSSQIHDLNAEMLKQLTCKVEIIQELESNLNAQNKKVESLELSCRELESMITDVKASLSQSENENALLKATIDTLNSTINHQKNNLESMHSDIDAYNNTIQELQNKLKEKDTDVNINDSILEKMIENEETFIANNDNMKNIIQSFKNTLDSRNKEIYLLRSEQSNNNDADNIKKELTEQLEAKNAHIDLLKEQVQKFTIEINEKDGLMSKLLSENHNWRDIQHQLSEKLTKEAENHNKLEKQYSETINLVESLKTANEQLTLSGSEKEIRVKELMTIHEELNCQIKMLSSKIVGLEDDFKRKEYVIISLEKEKSETQDHLKDIQHQFSEKFSEVVELQKQYSETINLVENLKTTNDQLSLSVSEKEIMAKELVTINEELSSQIQALSNKVESLEDDIMSKDSLLIAIKKEDSESEEHLANAKSSVNKLQNILMKLTGNVQEVPEIIGNFVVIFSAMNDSLNILESTVTEVLSQKEADDKTINNLRNEFTILNEKNLQEIEYLKSQIQTLIINEQKITLQKESLELKLNQVTQDLEVARQNLDTAEMQCRDLQIKLDQITDRYTNLQNDILSKSILITSLQKSTEILRSEISNLRKENKQLCENFKNDIDNLKNYLRSMHISFQELVSGKETEILYLRTTLREITKELDEKTAKMSVAAEINSQILKSILVKVLDLGSNLDIEKNFSCDIDKVDIDNIHEEISDIMDTIANAIKTFVTHKNCDNIDKNVSQPKHEITLLSEQNTKCMECSCLETKHQELLNQLEIIITEKNTFKKDLIHANTLLASLRNELELKVTEMDAMETKILTWQELEISLKQLAEQLQIENLQLKTRCSELESNPDYTGKNSTCNLIETALQSTPPSLLSICCEKIVGYIHPKDNSVSTSSSDRSFDNDNKEAQCNNCNILLSELTVAHNSNSKLKDTIMKLEDVNRQLVNEQDEVHKEVKLLLEPAYELQKKVINHRTNLSTLTATTYAENKLLKSQVKALQHHHSRFHLVCQRDIPAVKQQLGELMSILKNDVSTFSTENTSFKSFSLPDTLENKSMLSNFKTDETTLDGDLLMLDTTLTVSADNTLRGHDQTCLDTSQTLLCNEGVAQPTDSIILTDFSINDMAVLSEDCKKMRHNLDILRQENHNLRQQIDKYSKSTATKIDTQTSPSKFNARNCHTCEKYKNEISEISNKQQELNEIIKTLSQEIIDVKTEKEIINEKYENLTLEIPSTDALIRKLGTIEKERQTEVTKLTQTITNHTNEIKRLQDENDTLSTQVMENVTEVDDLNGKLQILKESNTALANKYTELLNIIEENEKIINNKSCPQCTAKDNEVDNLNYKLQTLIDSNTTLVNKCTELQSVIDENQMKIYNTPCPQCTAKDDMTRSLCIATTTQPHLVLNRSLSESETTTRFNKICTLQNELHAGKEDCKELTEDVTTIKNHLERSNISIAQNMDFDDSMVEGNIYTFSKEFDENPPSKNVMYNIPEEHATDVYRLDKTDCINYYIEITGTEKESLNCDMKLIDIMKMFYDNIIAKHKINAEILENKLIEYEQSKNEIEDHVRALSMKYKKVIEELEEKDKQFEDTSNILLLVKNNINALMEDISKFTESERNAKSIAIFKERLLDVLDSNFGFTSASVFEHLIDTIVNKHEKELSDVINRNNSIQQHLDDVIAKLDFANENLLQLKSQLTDKENEYNLLKAQKERVHEISNAVTLDIIKKEQEFNEAVTKGCQKLVEHNILSPSDIDGSLPINKSINLLIERFISEVEKLKMESEKQNLVQDMIEMKATLESKEKLLETFKVQNEKLQEINKTVSLDLIQKDHSLQEQKSLHEELYTKYEATVRENETNLNLITKVTEEINVLKQEIVNKQNAIDRLEIEFKTYKQNKFDKDNNIAELLNKIAFLDEEVNGLKTVNEMLIKEKESCAMDLERAKVTIKQNKSELEKMTSDILILRESVKDNVQVIDTLKIEAKSLLHQNLQLKKHFEEKCSDCSRLEMNIKTHEKTAEIQSKMIIRLQKQKEDDDKVIGENNKLLEQLKLERAALQKEIEHTRNNLKKPSEEIDGLKRIKESLEARICELETELKGCRRRTSLESNVDASRRRRQSIHDSQRAFSDPKQESGDNFKMDAASQWHAKGDDHLAEAEYDSSNRSTPLRLSKGRDSLQSRGEQEEEVPSRPQSVQATRRRRQSSHDLHRSVITTPDPHDVSRRLLDDLNNSKPGSATDARNLECIKLELRTCKQELEELRERYKELDEECDTCAEYLRERDEQCLRLKKEKATLENIVAELREKLQAMNPDKKQETKRIFSDASVNTDEDWANLHSVVVDRMSYDAVVEKSKRLTKTIEELRFKNQDLRATLAKMQKVLDKRDSGKDNKELETTKKELQACKVELEELRERYKELDEECETCAEYLRQRDEQCRKLKEAKIALEAKLQEFQTDHSAVLQSTRKRRQTLHDQNRGSVVHADVHDATTETSDDFLSYQVERDDGKQTADKSREMKRLKMAVDKLTQQKTALEHQLTTMSASHPMYIATGSAIVQNQQLTDVMKENQKLKKINAKLVTICKKRGKDTNRENEDPSERLA